MTIVEIVGAICAIVVFKDVLEQLAQKTWFIVGLGLLWALWVIF